MNKSSEKFNKKSKRGNMGKKKIQDYTLKKKDKKLEQLHSIM